MSHLRYNQKQMAGRRTLIKKVDETVRVRCATGIGVIREEVWVDQHNRIAKYNLAFINHRLCNTDNGRALGYDNAHGAHERHFKGAATSFAFTSYEALLGIFLDEVRALREESGMNTTIRADGLEGFARRATARAGKLDRREPVEAEVTLTFADPLDMLHVLTANRVRLVEAARKQKHSVSSLAAALKRDPKSVRRDVVKLEQVGMLRTYEETNPGHGRVRIVAPIAARVELRASL